MAMPAEALDLEELDDGSAIYYPEGREAAVTENHFENLAESLDEVELEEWTLELATQVEQDIEDSKDFDELYARGLERTGVGVDAPGGAEFSGATKTTHPVLAEAGVDASARILRELLPHTSWFIGKPTSEEPTTKEQMAADRKARLLDRLIRDDEGFLEEFTSEIEQLVVQEALAGSQYLRVWPDKRLNRPRIRAVMADDVILPASASSYRTALRRTIRERVTMPELRRRIASGQYREVELVAPSNAPDRTRPDEVVDRLQGVSAPSDNDDEIFTIYEVECLRRLDEGEVDQPYLLTYEEQSHECLSVYRNSDPQDPRELEIKHAVEWRFLPWRGARSIGLLHAIGGLAGAATGAMRNLLDAAHANTIATGVKLPGNSRGGETVNLRTTEVKSLDTSVSGDDIRKVFMPLPFNPPSPVLFQLLEFVVNAAKGMVRATVEGELNQPNMPVGTMLAQIDEGTVVFGSIFGRQVRAMTETGRLIGRIAAELDPKRYGELADLRDVVAAADPSTFSEAKRMGQAQAVLGRATATRQLGLNLYNDREAELRFLRVAKVPNPEELLVKEKKPARLDAVSENVAASMGQPIVAFPDQDHEAHLSIHLPFMAAPLLGKLAVVGPSLYPPSLEHLKQHVVLWYAQLTYDIASRASGQPMEELLDAKDPDLSAEFDRVMALASQRAMTQVTQKLQVLGIEPIIQMAIGFLQALQPPMQGDPALMAEVKRKTARDQAVGQEKAQELQQREADAQRKAQLQGMKLKTDAEQRELDRLLAKEEAERNREAAAQLEAARLATTESTTTQTNEVKLAIAGRDAELDERGRDHEAIEAEQDRRHEAAEAYRDRQADRRAPAAG